MANEMVKHVGSAEFERFLGETKVALVDFWATWCGPCRVLGPVIEQLAEEYDGRASVGKVNVDEEGALAQQFGVMSIPTVVVFENGKEVERRVGVMPLAEYRALLDARL